MKKYVKLLLSGALIGSTVIATAVSAVACNSNEEKQLFEHASTITVPASKYFGQMNIGVVLSIFKNQPNEQGSMAQTYLKEMGYSSASVWKASLNSSGNQIILEIILTNGTNTYSPLNLCINFVAQLPTPTVTEQIVPQDANQWSYIFHQNKNNLTPNQINISNGQIVSEYVALNNPNVLAAYQSPSLGSPSGVIYNNNLVIGNLIPDFDHFLKTQISQICNNWGVFAQQQMVNAGVNITSSGLNISGNVWWQITNSTSGAKTIVYEGQTFTVPQNGTIAFCYDLNNSPFSPALFPDGNNAILGYEFKNAQLRVQINTNDPEAFSIPLQITNSISINSEVINVSTGGNILNSANLLTQIVAQNIQSCAINDQTTKDVDSQTANWLATQIQNQVLSFFEKGINSIENFEPILQLLAQNVSILQFIQGFGQYAGQIIDQWMPNDYIGTIVANLFSNESISTFLYNTTGAVVGLLKDGMTMNGEIGTICDAIYDVYKMNFIGKTETQITNLIKGIPSMNNTLTDLLFGIGLFSPAEVVSIRNLVDELAKNENIFAFLGQNLQFIEGILKPLTKNIPIVNEIFGFLESIYVPVGKTALPDGIFSIPILNLLTGTDGTENGQIIWKTNIKTGIINLLTGIFGSTPPKVVQIIIQILEGTYPNWTVANLQSFLNGVINLPVYTENANGTITPLPLISNLASFFKTAIKPEITINNLQYNATTNTITTMNIGISFTFQENATISLKPIFPTFLNVLKTIITDNVSSTLADGIVNTAQKNTEEAISFYAGESVTLNLVANNVPIIPTVKNGQLGWTVPMMGQWKINLFKTINGILSANPTDSESGLLELAFGAIGINLSSVIQTPFWSIFQPLENLTPAETARIEPIISNFKNDVVYANYGAQIPATIPETQADNLWNQLIAETTISNIKGNNNSPDYTSANTALTSGTESLLQSIFDINLFNKLQGPNYLGYKLNQMSSQLIQPIYDVIPILTGNNINQIKIQIVFPIPILINGSVQNSLSYTISNPKK